jgi:hypothetical protein
MKARRLPLLFAFGVVLAGCSSEPYAPVSGRVYFNNAPIEGVEVMFQPVATKDNYSPGPGSFGITDSEGRYTLKVIGKDSRGAVIGAHKVRFSNKSAQGIQIPAKFYFEPKDFVVPPEGTDSADFRLTSK